MQLKKYFWLATVLLGNYFSSEAQIKPLQCAGPVPEAILSSSSKKAIELLNKSGSSNSEEGKVEREFTVSSTFIIDDIFQSGKVLYGDTLTNNINRIADYLLRSRPELRQSLVFFTLRSTMVNAFSTHQGYIFITTGLMSRAKNEAELAFILSHEIAHYVKKHNLESAQLESKLRKNQKEDIDDKLSQIYRYSRNHEFEADSLGYQLYVSAGYSDTHAISALKLVGRIDESFDNSDFSDTVFQSPLFKIKHATNLGKLDDFGIDFWVRGTYKTEYPSEHYYDQINDISEESSTHPAVVKRIAKLEKYGAGSGSGNIFQAIQEKDFYVFRNYARLEELLARLRQGDLVATIYNASKLADAPVDPVTMSDVKAMAHYGLAMHAVNGDDMQEFGVADNRSPGIHQVAGFYQDLNNTQICALAAREIYREILKHKEGNEFRLGLFKSVIRQLYRLPRFEMKRVSGSGCNSDSSHYVSNIFCDLKDQRLTDLLSAYHSEFDSLPKITTTSVESESKFRKLQKTFVTNITGYKQYKPLRLGIDSLLVISPSYSEYTVRRRTVNRNYFRDEAIESELVNEVNHYGQRLKMNMLVLRGAGDSMLTTEKINQYCALMDWLEERQHHGLEAMELYTANTDKQFRDLKGYHVAWVNNIVLKGKRKKFSQFVIVYQPATSEISAIALHDFKGKAGMDMIKSHLFDVFYQLNKKPGK